MNWTLIRPWIGTVCRLVLGAVFIWFAWGKLSNPRGFVEAVRAYDATPEWLSRAIGYGLPVLELCLGIMLILGVVTRAVASVTAALLAVFIIGIIQAAARGLKISCGCAGGGGITEHTRYTLDILRDVGLLAMAVFLIVWPLTKLSIDAYLARNDYVPPPSAKRMRTEQGQRKYNAMLAARRKEATTRSMYLTGTLAAVVVLVSVIGIGVQSGRAKIQGDLTATNASVKTGVVLGKSTAPATVDVYADFQCPICREFQSDAGATIDSIITSGKAKVRFHMISFLDSQSNGNRYSSRAANAAICASDISPEMFLKYHDYLFGEDKNGKQIQPEEGSNGRTNTDLINYAKAVGITGDQLTTFQSCVTSEQHKAFVQAATDQSSKDGVTGTPTVKVNGKTLSKNDKASLVAAVDAAANK